MSGTKTEMLSGAVGGLAGGLAMSGMLLLGQKMGMVNQPLPRRVVEWASEKTGVTLASETQAKAVSQAGHLAFSTAVGAGYGALYSRLKVSPWIGGPLYGLIVYLRDMVLVAPKLGITPGPWEEKPAKVAKRVGLHLLYGLVTALTFQRVRRILR